MSISTSVIRLPFRLTDLDEDMLVALNRNFAEIEFYLADLQAYMNNTGYASIASTEEFLNNFLLSGPEADLPTGLISDNGMRFHWSTDTKKLRILNPQA